MNQTLWHLGHDEKVVELKFEGEGALN